MKLSGHFLHDTDGKHVKLSVHFYAAMRIKIKYKDPHQQVLRKGLKGKNARSFHKVALEKFSTAKSRSKTRNQKTSRKK